MFQVGRSHEDFHLKKVVFLFNPGSQRASNFKSWWFLLDDDKPLKNGETCKATYKEMVAKDFQATSYIPEETVGIFTSRVVQWLAHPCI